MESSLATLTNLERFGAYIVGQYTDLSVSFVTITEARLMATAPRTPATSFADLHVANTTDADTEIRGGYPVAIAEELQATLNLSDADMADVIGRSRRTYARYRNEGKQLGLPESERVFRYVRLLRRATESFGSEKKASWWMTEPNAALGGRTPFDVAMTAPGAVLVDDLLAAIDHGHPV